MTSQVTLLPLQQLISVGAGETILDAGLRAGLNLPHSCKAGHCSSCRARILQGRVEYLAGRPLGLTADEERAGHALLCQARAATPELTIEVRRIPAPASQFDAGQIKSLPCRIEHRQPLAPDVLAVFLRLPAHEEFTFLAGQYVDVMLPQNRRRSFSIANAPHQAASGVARTQVDQGRSGTLLELHVRRVVGGEFTRQLFDERSEKTLLRIEGPLGQFWFREDSPRPAILIGGGTGYAPLRAMLGHLLERGDRRKLHLYWGAQTRVDLYDNAAIEALAARFPNLTYTPVLSEPQRAPGWSGRTGWVHAAALADHPDPRGFDIYASGPPAMVEAARQEFIARGLPQEQLFFDSFDYAPR